MRKILLAFATIALAAPALAEHAAAPTQPGRRMETGVALGERSVREVMISQGGGGIAIVYDTGAGAPRSQRVLRLENVNGMLEVIYDTAAPTMALGGGGTPRLVQRGGGMYSVEYDR